MNYEARLITLKRLKSEIEAATKTRALTPGGESADPALMGRVERWTAQVAMAQKEIKSGHHLNALRYGQMRFAKDFNARHQARQSFQSRERNLENLFAASVEVAIALGALLRQSGADTPGEAKAIEAIGGAMQNILKAMNTDTQMVQNFGLGQQEQVVTASIRQLETGQKAPIGPGGAVPVIDLFTLILAYFALIKSMRK